MVLSDDWPAAEAGAALCANRTHVPVSYVSTADWAEVVFSEKLDLANVGYYCPCHFFTSHRLKLNSPSIMGDFAQPIVCSFHIPAQE